MRSCFSGACFVQAHLREAQQAFLEGHVGGFEFFGGVFGLVRYDNLGSAVAKVMKGRRRIETDRFVALRSHYLCESSFTRAGKEARTRREVSRVMLAGSAARTSCRSRKSCRSPS